MCCRAASSIYVKEQQASHSHMWWIRWKPLVETFVLLFFTSQKQLKKFILHFWTNLSGRGFWICCSHSRNRASILVLVCLSFFFLACLKSSKHICLDGNVSLMLSAATGSLIPYWSMLVDFYWRKHSSPYSLHFIPTFNAHAIIFCLSE